MPRLVLIRGLPGSGKSTIAREQFVPQGFHHLEADMYFLDHDGNYVWNPDLIGTAHSWCQRCTEEYLRDGDDVVVSNTFTTRREMVTYFKIAKEFGVVPEIIVASGNYQNVHSVPEEVLERMRARWANDIVFE